MSTHSLPTPLDPLDQLGVSLRQGSVAQWCRQSPRQCVLFVHGFGGKAVETWGQMRQQAVQNPAFAQADLVFAGYESRERRASYNAALLHGLLHLLAETPNDVLDAVRGPRRAHYAYERIVLVGHSLGGALAREIAMAASEDARPWADQLRLALFAPAHHGADVIALATAGFPLLRNGFVRASLIQLSPALRDLEPGSPFIANLIERAKRIGVNTTTRASLIAHAEDERVVAQHQFYCDPAGIAYPNTDHVDLCVVRPPNFLRPITDIAQVLV